MQTYNKERTPGIRTESGAIRIFPSLLLALYVAAAAVFIPVSLFTDILALYPYIELLLSVAMPIAGIGVCIIVTVSPKPLIPFCIITAVIMFMGANITASSAICVFFTLVAICAYLLREKLWSLVALAGVLSCVAVLFLSKSLILTILCLAFFPISATLFWAFKKKKQRVGSICSVSVCMAICLAVILVTWIYLKDGSLSSEAVKGFFDSLREGLSSSMSSALVTASNELQAGLSLTDATVLVDSMITVMFNLFPAILAILLFVVSFIVHSLYISIVSPVLEDKSEITNAVTFNMSVISAVLFIVSYVLALILSYEGMPMYATVAQNIYTILFPGLTLITFGFVGSLAKTGRASCLGSILYIAMFGMLFFFTGVTVVVFSFAGAILVIVSSIKARKNNNNNNNNNKQ